MATYVPYQNGDWNSDKKIHLPVSANGLATRKIHWAALAMRDFVQWQHLKAFNSIKSVDLGIGDTCNQILGAYRKQQTEAMFS